LVGGPHLSRGFGELAGTVAPGHVLVVEAVVLEAAVQDTDAAVAQGSQGGVVGVAGGSVLVVERPGARRGSEGSERPEIYRIGEAAVADVAGEHSLLGARGASYG